MTPAPPATPRPQEDAPLALGVLASGRGSNLRALAAACDRGDLPARIALVVSNNSRAGALAFARERGIPARHISGKTDPDEAGALVQALRDAGVDVVALAGYMKLLPPAVLAAFPDRVVNIHPGPLPRFGGPGMYGPHVHRAVLDAGVPTSGPTVHRVSERYDEGPILAHRPVPVLPGDTPDTLAERVLAAEHDLYWRAIRDAFCARAT